MFNGVDLVSPESGNRGKELRKALGIPGDRLILLFVGKLEPHKGIREFVAALGSLRQHSDRFAVVVVGDGPLRKELEARAEEANLSGSLFFAGSVPHDRVPDYLALADVYVSLNREGNLSNTVLEALQARKCIVRLSSSATLCKDLFTDQVLGEAVAEVIDRDRVEELLPGLLLRLIDDRELIARKGRKSEEVAQAYLVSWERRIGEEIAFIKRAATTGACLEASDWGRN